MPETDYYSSQLADDCGYDSESLDGTVGELIDYKDALEGALDTVEGIIRDTQGMTLGEWIEANR